MPDVESHIALIKSLVSSISSRTAALTPEQMALPSACSEWEVQDVIAHLIGGADRQIGNMSRGKAGDSGPPQAAGGPTTPDLGARRDMHFRESMGDGLLAGFDDYYERLYGVLDGFQPDGWETPAGTSVEGRCPLGSISNCAFRSWQSTTGICAKPWSPIHPSTPTA